MNALTDLLCPACNQGHLVPQVGEYSTVLPDGERMTVPKVEFDACDRCGETAISLASSLKVEAYVAEQIELLSSAELIRIREAFKVDQAEMSEILGLDGKTYLRWEKGHQIPSRSMGYNLRMLAEFPTAFAWLRARSWRSRRSCAPNRSAPAPIEVASPLIPEGDGAITPPVETDKDLPQAEQRPEETKHAL